MSIYKIDIKSYNLVKLRFFFFVFYYLKLCILHAFLFLISFSIQFARKIIVYLNTKDELD